MLGDDFEHFTHLRLCKDVGLECTLPVSYFEMLVDLISVSCENVDYQVPDAKSGVTSSQHNWIFTAYA